MNEEEVIEKIKWSIQINNATKEINGDNTSINVQVLETVLNLLEKKDKIINEMAECIDIELSSSRLGIILNKNVKPLKSYKKDIKQYFERKVENGN